MIIRGLQDPQDEAIDDFRIGNDDVVSYKYEPMVALLAWWENIKKFNHGNYSNNQWKNFSPFVIYINLMLGR